MSFGSYLESIVQISLVYIMQDSYLKTYLERSYVIASQNLMMQTSIPNILRTYKILKSTILEGKKCTCTSVYAIFAYKMCSSHYKDMKNALKIVKCQTFWSHPLIHPTYDVSMMTNVKVSHYFLQLYDI